MAAGVDGGRWKIQSADTDAARKRSRTSFTRTSPSPHAAVRRGA
jgi:hypothetical protein